MNKFHWLFAVGLLLYALTAGAATQEFTGGVFDAPTQISMYNVWSFTYTGIPTNRFDETVISFGPVGAKLDDPKYHMGILHNNGNFAPDPLHGKGIVAYYTADESPSDVDGLTVYITYRGLDVGEYSLMGFAYVEKSLKHTSETRIKVINPAGQSQVDETSKQLSEAAIQLDDLKESKDQLSKKFNDMLTATQQAYQKFDDQLDSLNNSITSLQTQNEALDERTKTALTEMQANIQESQAEVKVLIDEKEQEKEAAKAGFLNLGNLSQYGPQALVGIVIAAILVGGYMVFKSRQGGDDFSDSDIESSLGGGGTGLAGWGKSDSKSSGSSGPRWAAPGSSSRGSESSTRIAIGSLVRK